MLGMTDLQINAEADYAIATLSMNGEVIASDKVIDGQCTLTFPGLSEVGMADLVIVGFNKETYVGQIEVVYSLTMSARYFLRPRISSCGMKRGQ